MAGIYVHIPFCRKKCLYCDFVSFPACGEGDFFIMNDYAAALENEMAARRESVSRIIFDTVFFGGGTPSFLEGDCFARIVNDIRKNFIIAKHAEFTIEANPESLTLAKAAQWLESGVNRISIGVQSFDNGELEIIGRVHDGDMAKNAVAIAKAAGFQSISLDLICGLPNQTIESLIKNIDTAAQLQVQHVSCYQLQVEENTPLCAQVKSGHLAVPSDDAYADMMNAAAKRLEHHGYQRYEVSNFAKQGFGCRHNMNYWQRGEYIGLGVAAHSLLCGVRMANTESLGKYLRGNWEDGRELLSAYDIETEQVMLSLRTSAGIDIKSLSDEQVSRAVSLAARGLLSEAEGRFFATDRGFEVLNSVILFLLEG